MPDPRRRRRPGASPPGFVLPRSVAISGRKWCTEAADCTTRVCAIHSWTVRRRNATSIALITNSGSTTPARNSRYQIRRREAGRLASVRMHRSASALAGVCDCLQNPPSAGTSGPRTSAGISGARALCYVVAPLVGVGTLPSPERRSTPHRSGKTSSCLKDHHSADTPRPFGASRSRQRESPRWLPPNSTSHPACGRQANQAD